MVARGVTGRLDVWRAGKALADMIAKAAARTVKENEKTGARFASWTPLPEDLGSDAVSRDPVFAPAANL